jgi:hypothetical protein
VTIGDGSNRHKAVLGSGTARSRSTSGNPNSGPTPSGELRGQATRRWIGAQDAAKAEWSRNGSKSYGRRHPEVTRRGQRPDPRPPLCT